MEQSYLDYALSVIVSRALPDCRDGMKPVHRRALYAMYNTGNSHNKPYRKSARVVGEVMGKYHPHGDNPIYSSIVRMAQTFSLRHILVDGQGNFGSVDGDEAAHMRYTEVRLAKISDQGLLVDLDYDTVDFVDNYDGSVKEPQVLPASFPNLLVNGASGIAVGMATNIPTHNLGEVIDACCAYIENDQITAEEMLNIIPAPDFPTGGKIVGHERVTNAMLKGRGSIIVRGSASIEEENGKNQIIITEIPYQVNKSELIKNIELLAKNKTIEGISGIKDETNKLGMRVVIDLKRDTEGEVILKKLYKHTQLQTYIGINMLSLKNNRPTVMNFRDVIASFVKFREEVVTRRTNCLLQKARNRAHVLIGLLIALENINEIIPLIKSSSDSQTAKTNLLTNKWRITSAVNLIIDVDDHRNEIIDDNKTTLTDEQSKAILEMRLQRLTGLEKNKIAEELEDLIEKIKYYLSILGSRDILLAIIKDELLAIKDKFNSPRLTTIVADDSDISEEDLIQREDMIVTMTSGGYIKRTSLSLYREQQRGGRGKSALSMHEDDIVINAIVTNTHHTMLFFSNLGKVYKKIVYQLPLGGLQHKGRALVNLLPLEENEKIYSVLAVNSNQDNDYIFFATAKGIVKKNSLDNFDNIPSNGKIAIKLAKDDSLIGVSLCSDNDHVILATKGGKAVRFAIEEVRIFKSRNSEGVRGVKLHLNNDAVVSLSIINGVEVEQNIREHYLSCDIHKRLKIHQLIKENDQEEAEKIAKEMASDILLKEKILELAKKEQLIMSVTSLGYGKRTSAYEYRVSGRGVQGVTNINLTQKNGYVISSFPVSYEDSVIIITDKGVLIRTSTEKIRITGRNTIGVKVINLQEGDSVSSISKIIDNIQED